MLAPNFYFFKTVASRVSTMLIKTVQMQQVKQIKGVAWFELIATISCLMMSKYCAPMMVIHNDQEVPWKNMTSGYDAWFEPTLCTCSILVNGMEGVFILKENGMLLWIYKRI